LVKLNRKQEAADTMDYALHRAPQSSYSHANKGWVSIEKGAYEEAITHFKEALRLNATNAYAKAGLREGIKAKNFLYRGVLKYFLWLGKLQAKYRWAFVILSRNVGFNGDYYDATINFLCFICFLFLDSNAYL